jgi:hypothetical protein
MNSNTRRLFYSNVYCFSRKYVCSRCSLSTVADASKMLFFGSHCEKLCMMQFSLISLIPGLIRSLQDCADPALDSREEDMVMPTSLKTSERASLLAYVGLPLHTFGKGSLFGPYTPLQQLDILADHDTKSYVVGSTNSLLLAQKERYSDILINVWFTMPNGKSALTICSWMKTRLSYHQSH